MSVHLELQNTGSNLNAPEPAAVTGTLGSRVVTVQDAIPNSPSPLNLGPSALPDPDAPLANLTQEQRAQLAGITVEEQARLEELQEAVDLEKLTQTEQPALQQQTEQADPEQQAEQAAPQPIAPPSPPKGCFAWLFSCVDDSPTPSENNSGNSLSSGQIADYVKDKVHNTDLI